MNEVPSTSAAGRRFALIALFLAVLIPLTLLLREWHVSQIEGQVVQQQVDRTEHALAVAERDFYRLQDELLLRARRLAERQVLIRALREREREGEVAISETLVRLVEDQQLDDLEGLDRQRVRDRLTA
ncbi:MAG: hypothetical protein ACOCTG_05365, partial [Bacteroidota bacterium]